MAGKPDPYDTDALGNAVNDSASRVSAIWITFLIFSLYLPVALGTVTQRQLFLDEPTKLPVLNIDLPLWWFFLLAPILFVILHIYVLLQVLLLGRTAASYNAALARLQLSADENISLRQRLANTIFAQIFAGSPREREGFVGALLQFMVWITLAAAPILIVVAFQFRFLPYHSQVVTWMHRLLILIELAAFFLIWPLALDAKRDFQWPRLAADLRRLAALPLRLVAAPAQRGGEWLWLRDRAAPFTACLLYIVVCLAVATFPGEPHVNLVTLSAPGAIQCDRWLQQKFAGIGDLRFDRIIVPDAGTVDDQKLAKMAEAKGTWTSPVSRLAERPWTHNLQERDLNCSVLQVADLRGANLNGAQLQGANLNYSDLRSAALIGAQLQGPRLGGAQLQGAMLPAAQLQGANLNFAALQGANLTKAQLQGADFSFASLQGAVLDGVQAQGASFGYAQLEGASLDTGDFSGAQLGRAQLQGAVLPKLDDADLSRAFVWRAALSACPQARFTDLNSDAVFEIDFEKFSATAADAAENFIKNSIADILNEQDKNAVSAQMRKGLIPDPKNNDTAARAKSWSDCEAAAGKISQQEFDRRHTARLRELACNATQNTAAVVCRDRSNLGSKQKLCGSADPDRTRARSARP